MKHFQGLIYLVVITLIMPSLAVAAGNVKQVKLMRTAYTNAQILTNKMEYLQIVEAECSQPSGATPYQDWLSKNADNVPLVTEIQEEYKAGAIAHGGERVADNLESKAKRMKEMTDMASKVMGSATGERKQGICEHFYAGMNPGAGEHETLESNLSYLIKNRKKIMEALANEDNWSLIHPK